MAPLMTQLLEISSVRQLAGEYRRRWFTSSTMDLFVWCDESDAIVGFQFTYDKGSRERALTWRLASGFVHDAVDDGESHMASRYKATPLLRTDGQPNIDRIVDLLVTGGAKISPAFVLFISAKIREYPVGTGRA
jgi:hypothetical protein